MMSHMLKLNIQDENCSDESDNLSSDKFSSESDISDSDTEDIADVRVWRRVDSEQVPTAPPHFPFTGNSGVQDDLSDKSDKDVKHGRRSVLNPPAGVRGRKRILGAFIAQNRVWWQQCDMSRNHSLIINIY